MARSVILRHDLPDGSHHFDWLLDPTGSARPGGPDERSLVAWRLPAALGPGVELIADRLAPHRRLYLEHEGPVSGGRGVVRRVGVGEVVIVADEPARFEAFLTLAGARLRVRGEPVGEGRWRLRVDELPDTIAP